MRNEFTEFKLYLQLLSPEEQLFETESFIKKVCKDNTPYFNTNRKYSRIKELKDIRNRILANQWNMAQNFLLSKLQTMTVNLCMYIEA